MSILKDLRPFSPAGFFQLRAKIHRAGRKQPLPDTTGLLNEQKFADIALSWSFSLSAASSLVQKSLFPVLLGNAAFKPSRDPSRGSQLVIW